MIPTTLNLIFPTPSIIIPFLRINSNSCECFFKYSFKLGLVQVIIKFVTILVYENRTKGCKSQIHDNIAQKPNLFELEKFAPSKKTRTFIVFSSINLSPEFSISVNLFSCNSSIKSIMFNKTSNVFKKLNFNGAYFYNF